MLRIIRMMAGYLFHPLWKGFFSYKFLFCYRLKEGMKLIESVFINASLHALPTRH